MCDIVSYLLGKKAGGGGGGSGLDWNAIGYSETPQSIIDGYNYAKEIKDNWVPGTSLGWKWSSDKNLIMFPYIDLSQNTSTTYMCQNCQSLISVASIDTNTITNFSSTFTGCRALKEVPILDFSSATNLGSMFSNCINLSDNSVDNILVSCIGINPNYTGGKTLKDMGFSANISVSRIEALPHYQAFIDAGWAIGY